MVFETEIPQSGIELECDPSNPFHRYAPQIDVSSDDSSFFIVRLFQYLYQFPYCRVGAAVQMSKSKKKIIRRNGNVWHTQSLWSFGRQLTKIVHASNSK